MQIDETVHGCPVAVVHRIVRVEILALQVKSGPLPGSRLWLRPVGCAMIETTNPSSDAGSSEHASSHADLPLLGNRLGNRLVGKAQLMAGAPFRADIVDQDGL